MENLKKRKKLLAIILICAGALIPLGKNRILFVLPAQQTIMWKSLTPQEILIPILGMRLVDDTGKEYAVFDCALNSNPNNKDCLFSMDNSTAQTESIQKMIFSKTLNYIQIAKNQGKSITFNSLYIKTCDGGSAYKYTGKIRAFASFKLPDGTTKKYKTTKKGLIETTEFPVVGDYIDFTGLGCRRDYSFHVTFDPNDTPEFQYNFLYDKEFIAWVGIGKNTTNAYNPAVCSKKINNAFICVSYPEPGMILSKGSKPLDIKIEHYTVNNDAHFTLFTNGDKILGGNARPFYSPNIESKNSFTANTPLRFLNPQPGAPLTYTIQTYGSTNDGPGSFNTTEFKREYHKGKFKNANGDTNDYEAIPRDRTYMCQKNMAPPDMRYPLDLTSEKIDPTSIGPWATHHENKNNPEAHPEGHPGIDIKTKIKKGKMEVYAPFDGIILTTSGLVQYLTENASYNLRMTTEDHCYTASFSVIEPYTKLNTPTDDSKAEFASLPGKAKKKGEIIAQTAIAMPGESSDQISSIHFGTNIGDKIVCPGKLINDHTVECLMGFKSEDSVPDVCKGYGFTNTKTFMALATYSQKTPGSSQTDQKNNTNTREITCKDNTTINISFTLEDKLCNDSLTQEQRKQLEDCIKPTPERPIIGYPESSN